MKGQIPISNISDIWQFKELLDTQEYLFVISRQIRFRYNVLFSLFDLTGALSFFPFYLRLL